MNKAQNDYDRQRGSSATADKWKAEKEKLQKQQARQEHLDDLANKYGLVNPTPQELKRALMKDRLNAEQEGAEAMKDAAFWNDMVNGADFVEKTSDTLINVLGESQMPGARAVKNLYTVAKAMGKHGMQGAVRGQGWGEVVKELGIGAAEGGMGVLQNQEFESVFGTSLSGTIVKSGVNVGLEMGKSVVNNLFDSDKSAKDILDEATNAGVNRVGFELVGNFTKSIGGGASDVTQQGLNELSSFSQEMGFHNPLTEEIGEELNLKRQQILGI